MSTTERAVSGLIGPAASIGERESEARESDLHEIFPQLAGHVLRTRYVEVEPGGMVRVHSHECRPSFYLMIEGELEVHRSDRKRLQRLRTGETTSAVQGVAHWWHNPTDQPARLFVADLRPKSGKASGLAGDPSAHAGAQATAEDGALPSGLPHDQIAGFEGPALDVDEVNVLIDETPLSADFPGVKGAEHLWMRTRWIDVGVGGVVPRHDHRRRPNIIRVMTGTLTFHGPGGRQDYPAGSVVLEAGPEPHWWENSGQAPVRLYAVDVYDKTAGE